MTTEIPEFLIFIVSEKLSDGSQVFNVIFGEMKFPAVTEDDAVQLAETISNAINDHTNNRADVIYE